MSHAAVEIYMEIYAMIEQRPAALTPEIPLERLHSDLRLAPVEPDDSRDIRDPLKHFDRRIVQSGVGSGSGEGMKRGSREPEHAIDLAGPKTAKILLSERSLTNVSIPV